jgi:signal transduction histidine kinase/DNA-binding NarL/FixJ family response regulator/purine-cytosine permease-like protein
VSASPLKLKNIAIVAESPQRAASASEASSGTRPPPRQRIVRERRQYNKWAATQTLEDYALRYTAEKARRYSPWWIANTALGAISFLACEAIGGGLTLQYGFTNAVTAIVVVCALMFLIGLPIASYAAKYGLDIDLLTRGAGFGYMGSTITSLIYASFTFLLFAIEASIMSEALRMVLGIPLWIAHLISSLVVIPIAIYGISFISRMQIATQPIWLLLQLAVLIFIAVYGGDDVKHWTSFTGDRGSAPGKLDLLLFAAAASTLLSLLPQIGEQADYLRFLPNRHRVGAVRWWTALLSAGPGWVLMGGLKLAAGSFLAVLALSYGVPEADARQPTQMFLVAFERMLSSPTFALVLTGVFVITCQLKINVTNAYAGSIAWSNFFSRLTHAHPGRVVWLVFNVLLALLLMEVGILHAIESILVLYANFAVGWIGALTADLVINKPLGWSPSHAEFKRAHLYDINPVGTGAMLLSIVLSTLAFVGSFGALAQALSPFIGLVTAFFAAPLIAWMTRGRYYLARDPDGLPEDASEIRCVICENTFERSDMAICPAYAGTICSLCCTLEARCHDLCKDDSRFGQQIHQWLGKLLPERIGALVHTSIGHFLGILFLFNLVIGCLLSFIYFQYGSVSPENREVIGTTLSAVFFCLFILAGLAAWLMVLAHESRNAAQRESAHQTTMLMDEIEAHQRTDTALQKAKEVAEAANVAKTRYIVGISHEIRTPLNSIFGYAQLLERGAAGPPDNAIRIIRRSAEHLANLVDGLLDISKIENGMLRLNRDKVQLVEFLGQIVDMFRLQAASRGIEFRYQCPAHLPAYVHTDEKRLRQILINLLSNAIKYTDQGHASLSVRYRSQVAEFEISDTGVGIPEADLERVFEPFERGQSPGVRSIPGTGLGLTITKLLTQILGGEVLVRSTPRVGTTFTVRLLLSEARDAAPALRCRAHDYSGPRLTVLLIDDDPAHLDIVQSLLRPLHFNVVAASNGRAGLELATQARPDLALIDVSMPDMSGWDVVRELRALAELPKLKIVMVSANAHEYSRGGGELAHDAFIMKPIDVQLLLDCIAGLMGIQWTYASDAAVSGEASAAHALPSSARHHVDDLYRLGRIGHVRGIEAKLREIEAEDPSNKPFAAHLRSLLAGFDMKRYMNVLETMRNDG